MRRIDLWLVRRPSFAGTNPLDADSDADRLNDRAELEDVGTNPSNADSDDDGALYGDEAQAGTDPNDAGSTPP